MHIAFESFLNPAHNSRNFKKKDGKVYNSLSTDLPLGAMSISAYLKKHIDIDVQLIDFNAEINALDAFPFENFYDCCISYLENITTKPDFIGISSLFSPSFYNFIDCGKAAKKIFPNSLVIGGGNIPTNSYASIYESALSDVIQGGIYYDGLCFGEGEKPMLELLKSQNPIEYMNESASWITYKKLHNNPEPLMPKHNFIENLDEIPFLDYDLCDLKKHSSNQVVSSSYGVGDKLGFHIMTSRGCPYFCTFCASHRTHGRKMRYYSIDRVRADLIKLKDKYNAGTIIFQDDHLMSDKQRVYSILEIIKDLGVISLYQNGLTLYALDREMLQAFYDAGVRHLALPVESGSEKVLKEQMKKPLKLRISERVARDCRELGIYTNSFVMIGMPGETKEDLEQGRLNLRNVPTNWFNVACASPIVGSDMHNLARQKKYIKLETLGSDFRTAIIETEDFSAEYIQDYQYRMNLELNFVLNQDIKFGEYKLALKAFKNVIRMREDHAFAYYYSAVCYKGLGQSKDEKIYFDLYLKFSDSVFWKKWIEFFQLPTSYNDFNQLTTLPPSVNFLYSSSERFVELDTQ